MKIVINCYVTADILVKVLQKCSLSSLLPNILFAFRLVNLIGCHGNWKPKIEKNIKNHLKSHKGDKAET